MKENLIVNQSERGSAGLKLTVALVILFIVAHAGYNFIPVAYEGTSFKEEMQTAVLQGTVLPTGGDAINSTKVRLRRSADANHIPQDAIIEVKKIPGGLQANASYSKKINILPFGLYVYDYQFSHTATPGGFLTKSQ